jgi:hypothetical protein
MSNLEKDRDAMWACSIARCKKDVYELYRQVKNDELGFTGALPEDANLFPNESNVAR